MGKIMSLSSQRPRILFVTPEVSFVPASSGENPSFVNIESNGFADFLSGLFCHLLKQGADVHIAQPNYRSAFAAISQNKSFIKTHRFPNSRIHLTEDRVFFYADSPESNCFWENLKISLAFQREIVNFILPFVQPDLIHCHGWMSGLIPAVAKSWEIPSVFTFQSLETGKSLLAEIEDVGIDAAAFWQHLFFDRFPFNYEETRETNAIDFLLSGIFAADHSCIAGPALLVKIGENLVRFPQAPLGQVLSEKMAVGCSVFNDYFFTGMQYIDLYEKLLRRPVVSADVKKSWRDDSLHSYPDISYLSRGRRMDSQIM